MAHKNPIYLTRAQSRAVDQIAVRDYGMLGLVLMENAGRGCADCIQSIISQRAEACRGPIVICCGKGNNGGDGLVIARHLTNAGFEPWVLLWASPAELTGDAAANYAVLNKMHAKITALGDERWPTVLTAIPAGHLSVIDALLGTGAQGEPRAPYDQAIAWINARQGLVFAIDLPSGLDADSGIPGQNTVMANYTLALVSLKVGFRAESARPFLGETIVIDIGVPREVIDAAAKKA